MHINDNNNAPYISYQIIRYNNNNMRCRVNNNTSHNNNNNNNIL